MKTYTKMNEPNRKNIGASDYSKHPDGLQVWDIVAGHRLDFFRGNILKYLLRRKSAEEDEMAPRKMLHYAEKKLELMRMACTDDTPPVDITIEELTEVKEEYKLDFQELLFVDWVCASHLPCTCFENLIKGIKSRYGI